MEIKKKNSQKPLIYQNIEGLNAFSKEALVSPYFFCKLLDFSWHLKLAFPEKRLSLPLKPSKHNNLKPNYLDRVQEY